MLQSVLVETQDKALRRIGELREQCSLEQQAKAHLESALRLEMDEQQCVIKTLKTKLSLLGENPEEIVRNEKDSNLINLSDNGDMNDTNDNRELIDGTSASAAAAAAATATEQENLIVTGASIMINDSNEKIEMLDAQLAEEKSKFDELNRKFEASQKKIKELIAREEENTFLLAQNKLAIHSELENKEKEMRSLKNDAKQSASEKECLNEIVTELREENSKANARIKELSEAKQTLEQRLDDMKKSALTFEGDIKELRAKVIVLDSEKQSIISKTQTEMEKFKARYGTLQRKNEELEELNRTKVMESHEKIETELKHVKEAHAEVSRQLNEQISKAQGLEQQLQEAMREHRETVQHLNGDIDAGKADKMKLEVRFKQLFEEKQVLATQAQTDKNDIDKLRAHIDEAKKVVAEGATDSKTDHASAVDELNERIKVLTEEQATIRDQLKQEQKEKNDALTDVANLKAKIEMLKHEKRDLEKTLEKEIRDKTELQTQVTNILNEIGRLEDQLKEVKQSYADLEREKQALEEKSQSVKSAHIDRKEALALANKVSDLETQNAVLEEHNRRLQAEQIDADETLKHECERLQEKLKQSLDEYAVLFNTKEQMDQDHRSLLDQIETKEKEKLCAISANEILEGDLAKLREELTQRQHLEEEKTQLATECDRLRLDLDSVRTENEQLAADKSELASQVTKLSADLRAAETMKDTLKQEIDAMSVRSSGDKDKLNDELQKLKVLADRQEGFDQMKIENEYLNKSVTQLETDLRRYQDEKATIGSEIDQLKEKLKSQQCELYVLTEQQATRSETFEKKDFEIEQLKEICQRSQTCAEDLQREMHQKAQQIDALKLLNDGLQQKEDSLNGKLEKLQKEFDDQCRDRQTEQTVVTAALEEKQRASDELEKRVASLEREIESSRAIISDLNTDLNEQSTKCTEIETQYAESQAKRKELETDLSVAKSTNANGDTSKQLDALRKANEMFQSELAETKSKCEKEFSNLKEEIAEYEDNAKAYGDVQLQLVDLTTTNATMSQEIATLKSRLDEKSEKSSDDDDAVAMEEQLEQLKREKDEVESKLTTILNEVQDVSNRNLFLEQKCENFLILEQSNERLKLQNSKLSRQLDETLVNFDNEIDCREIFENKFGAFSRFQVSIQHTEGISANTEFEYLKNIMFQVI